MWQMNWGFRDLLPTGVRTVKRLTEYLQATWPYFDRKGGADHIWVFGHDQGAWRVRQKLPLIAKVRTRTRTRTLALTLALTLTLTVTLGR